MRRRRQVFEVASTLVVVVCALVVVGIQTHSLFSSQEPEQGQVEDWREVSASGIWMGPSDAEFIVTAFIDFTCPYCRALAPVLDSLETTFDNRVAVVFHHYPLGRTWSLQAAIAAECAYRQGRFRDVARVLYDELATDAEPDWASIAEEGGVSRVAEFLKCVDQPEDSFPRIGNSMEVGRRSGVRGTPTVWVNGTPTDARDLAGFEAVFEGS